MAAGLSGQSLITTEGDAKYFALAQPGRVAPICYDSTDAPVVGIAARDLARDVERVTGLKPALSTEWEALSGATVLIGTLGRSRLIEALVSAGKLDAERIRGKWETFMISVVQNPFPGVPRALVIAGSDRRGTAFGVYELSRQIGVSPWNWWADVPPRKSPALYVHPRGMLLGPPSVQYRGIFLNDEDWGLHPWASRTFEPESGDIGPKTYARIFELLLRLKANTLWPAMHPTTKAFNHFPRNKVVADRYAIVMGSSHAEPMLRNNVSEWTAPKADFNYQSNRDGVLGYWEKRVSENGAFENLYTIGMRGIHDSGIMGAQSTAEKVALLEGIFTDQRALLAQYVNPNPAAVPQVFTPYKEVLELYRAGLSVPEDVTIVFPDDNFGYIRSFPNAGERQRPGGFGVYYHLSYLGAPLAYLWLYTTPPALVWQEMSKAYDHGARTLWIANVGDLKPAEIGMSFFLEMAWDIHRWNRNTLPAFLRDWTSRQFGAEHAGEIAAILEDYFLLNFQRKPEHLQWWLPGQKVKSHPLTEVEVQHRLGEFERLVEAVARLEGQMPPEYRDAFFELVAYPVRGAALANQRYFYAEAYARNINDHPMQARDDAARARLAQEQLIAETRRYNEEIAGGKWRHLMALEPADNQWRGFRISPIPLPAEGLAADSLLPDAPEMATIVMLNEKNPDPHFLEEEDLISIAAGDYSGRQDRGGVSWEKIPGLGRTGRAVAVFPTTAASPDPGTLRKTAPWLDYRITFPRAGTAVATVHLLPVHALVDGQGLRLAIGLDDQAPQEITQNAPVGSPEWAQGVLDGVLTASVSLNVATAGEHVLRVYMMDAGVVLDRITVGLGEGVDTRRSEKRGH